VAETIAMFDEPGVRRGSAVFSPCGLYRYRIERPYARGHLTAAGTMLNPSYADADDNDHTMTKIAGFSARLDVGRWHRQPAQLQGRVAHVVALLRETGKPIWCWGRTVDGHPRHPLMLSYSTPLEVWAP
jgi:hypothetical protein